MHYVSSNLFHWCAPRLRGLYQDLHKKYEDTLAIHERELLETRLCECDFIHSRRELSIHLGMQIEKKLSKIRGNSLARHKTL